MGKKGQITFGGIDDGHVIKDTAAFAPLLNGKHYAFRMKKLMIGETVMCKDNDASCISIIDTGCRSIKGPNEIVMKFLKDVLSELPNKCIS